ncbi:hypothetical protein [Flavobacterium sp. J27]|uniref:hypothetical protein n=1 Tax=Flavobacterium sp. J27 TaxID=2060419 RepID=UPI00103004A8|nr:hypothetical protein [Flavobacterium sp. J27]
MAVKQGTDAVTDLLVPAIDPQDNSKTSGKFINAVVGHNTTASTPADTSTATSRLNRSLNSPYTWNGGNTPVERVTPVLANKAPLGV